MPPNEVGEEFAEKHSNGLRIEQGGWGNKHSTKNISLQQIAKFTCFSHATETCGLKMVQANGLWNGLIDGPGNVLKNNLALWTFDYNAFRSVF